MTSVRAGGPLLTALSGCGAVERARSSTPTSAPSARRSTKSIAPVPAGGASDTGRHCDGSATSTVNVWPVTVWPVARRTGAAPMNARANSCTDDLGVVKFSRSVRLQGA